MKNTMDLIFLGILIVACFIISGLQFSEKGFLLNNSYIFASEHERKTMNKKLYYKQSGIVFLLLGILLSTVLFAVVLADWLYYCAIGIAVITIAYSVVSSVMIEKEGK